MIKTDNSGSNLGNGSNNYITYASNSTLVNDSNNSITSGSDIAVIELESIPSVSLIPTITSVKVDSVQETLEGGASMFPTCVPKF